MEYNNSVEKRRDAMGILFLAGYILLMMWIAFGFLGLRLEHRSQDIEYGNVLPPDYVDYLIVYLGPIGMLIALGALIRSKRRERQGTTPLQRAAQQGRSPIR